MSWCKQCKVEILDETDQCPLCRCVLEHVTEGRGGDATWKAGGERSEEIADGERSEEIAGGEKSAGIAGSAGNSRANGYPDVRFVNRKLRLFSNVVLFVSIVLATVFVYINYLFRTHIWWSILVALALGYANAVLRLAILGKSSYRVKIVSMFFAAVLFLLGIDLVTGYRGWSVNFSLPGGVIAIDVGILILMIVNRRNWQSYIIFQLFMILLSLIPLLLIALGIITVPYVAVAAFFFSLFIFLGTMIIGDRRARTELKRRFHL